MIIFTRKYKPDEVRPGDLLVNGKELELTNQVQYLGVILDPKLNWKQQVDAKCNKAIVAFHQLRRSVGKTWGLTPRVVWWLYTAVIRPMVTYAAVVWWPHADQQGAGKQLEYIQQLACLYITGAVRTAPTSALEIIVGIVPLPIYIKQEAMLVCYRMQLNHQWVQTCW